MSPYIHQCCQLGCNIDAPIDQLTGNTLLHTAAKEEKIRIIFALLAAGASPVSKNSCGQTPESIAESNGLKGKVKWNDYKKAIPSEVTNVLTETSVKAIEPPAAIIDEKQQRINDFYMAAKNGDIPGATKLLAKDRHLVLYKNENHENGIHIAAANGQIKMMELLIPKGSDVSLRNNAGRNPLFVAAAAGQVGSVKYLLRQGCTYNALDKEDKSLFHVAAENGHLGVLKAFVEWRPQECSKYSFMMDKDKNNKTPIELARVNNHPEVVEFLERLSN